MIKPEIVLQGDSAPIGIMIPGRFFTYENHKVCTRINPIAEKMKNNNPTVEMVGEDWGLDEGQCLKINESLVENAEYLVYSYDQQCLIIIPARSIVYPLEQVAASQFKRVITEKGEVDRKVVLSGPLKAEPEATVESKAAKAS